MSLKKILLSMGRRISIPVAKGQRGMSLIEIVIVIALIGTIMSVIISQVTSTSDEAMRDTAFIAMQKIGQNLQIYRVHNHRYPNTEEGLEALVSQPANAKKWRGPYEEAEKLNDPWGMPFRYESDGRKFRIFSDGSDQISGTEDDVSYPEADESAQS